MLNNNFQNEDEASTGGGPKRACTDNSIDTQNKRKKLPPADMQPATKITTQFLPLSSATFIGNILPNSSHASPFIAFLENLKQLSLNTPSDLLAKHISKEDLMIIFDYFNQNTAKNTTIKHLGPKIKALTPTQEITLDKKDTGLPRTIKIIRSTQGVFELSIECMMPPKSFLAFCYNIRELQDRKPTAALLQLISHEDLKKIFDYFTFNNNKNPTVKEFALKLKKLAPNESLRLDKHKTLLPRTLNVICTNEGEFLLLLETKSKLADGTKKTLPTIEGAYKSGKPCWRIDSSEVEYFNLITFLSKDKHFQSIKEEVLISQKFGCNYIDTKQLGEKFEKNGVSKISLYAEKSSCGSLEDFFKSKEFDLLTLSQKLALLLDICHGIKVFHDQNYVHQDIKPDNILIKGNAQIGYHAVLTDFGAISVQHDSNKWAMATLGYQSPEITANFQKPNPTDATYTHFYEYLNDKKYCPTLAHQLVSAAISDKLPHKANDMWALGVVAYEILYNKIPLLPQAKTLIVKNVLLNGLLDPNRQQRFTVEQTIEMLQELLKKPTLTK